MGSWWLEKSMRMIQTNLREIDADLDAAEFVNSLKEFSADVVLFNAGGIVANYPTELEYHYRNPFMEDDLMGKVITRVKEEGIRFIARFDFSKVNEEICIRYPEWMYKGIQGEAVNYNGQIHVCVNSTYQQEYALKILEEVIDNYPIDGVFFNMIGYHCVDYSYVYHGICQCDNCKKRFMDMFGLEPPLQEDFEDPVFRQYDRFRQITSRELFNRITEFVKSKSKDIAICTYTHEGADIYRKESNSGIDRPLPEWNYSASENVMTVLGSWDNMVVSNTAVHFVDGPFRHSAVPSGLTQLRLAQNMIHGGWMDYYVIGTLNNQADRMCFEGVKELFFFHRKNESFFTGLDSVADIGLIAPHNDSFNGSMMEFRGLFRILSENHLLFDVLHDSVLDSQQQSNKLSKYQAIVLPDVRSLSDRAVEALDAYVENGGKILATGFSATCDYNGNPLGYVALKCSGLSRIRTIHEKKFGSYFRISDHDKNKLSGFSLVDLVYNYGEMMECDLLDAAEAYFKHIPQAMFGPPEKCYYTNISNTSGMVEYSYFKGKCVFIPWNLGKNYEHRSNPVHAMLTITALNELLAVTRTISTDAPALVEIASQVQKDYRRQLISFVNLSGQLGTAFLPPLVVRDVKVRVKPRFPTTKVYALKLERELDFKYTPDGYIEIVVPQLHLMDTIVME